MGSAARGVWTSGREPVERAWTSRDEPGIMGIGSWKSSGFLARALNGCEQPGTLTFTSGSYCPLIVAPGALSLRGGGLSDAASLEGLRRAGASLARGVGREGGAGLVGGSPSGSFSELGDRSGVVRHGPWSRCVTIVASPREAGRPWPTSHSGRRRARRSWCSPPSHELASSSMVA